MGRRFNTVALFIAVKEDETDKALTILNNPMSSVDVNFYNEFTGRPGYWVTKDEPTALYWAAKNGNLTLVNALLAKGADPDIGSPSPLFIAVESGHVDVVERLLQEETLSLTDHNFVFDKRAVESYYPPQGSLLHLAAKHGHTDIANKLMAADLSYTSPLTYQPIATSSVQSADRKPYHLFSPSHPFAYCQYPLGLAITFENFDTATAILDKMLNQKSPTHQPILQDALCAAILHGNSAIALKIINSFGEFGELEAPCKLAVGQGQTEVVTALINKGALVNQSNRDWNPLDMADRNGHTETVKVLYQAGAKPGSNHFWHRFKTVLSSVVVGIVSFGLRLLRKPKHSNKADQPITKESLFDDFEHNTAAQASTSGLGFFHRLEMEQKLLSSKPSDVDLLEAGVAPSKLARARAYFGKTA